MQRRPVSGTAPASGPRTITLPPLSIRAAVASFDEQERTVDVVLSTGAPVERMDYWTGKRYIEKLSLDPAHVNLDRLNAGAPLLDSHSAYSVSDQLGAVVRDSVKLTKSEIRATVRFSRRDAVEGVWQDVMDGLVTSLSIGYRVRRYEETEGKGNVLPVRLATDWEVYEASMVSVPADAGAKVRDGQSNDGNPCEIVPAGYVGPPHAEQTRVTLAPSIHIDGAGQTQEQIADAVIRALKQPKPAAPVAATPKKETRAMEPNDPEFIAEEREQPPKPKAAPVEPTEADEARKRERARNQGITLACRAARLPSSFADGLISEGIELVDAQARVFAELAKRDAPAHGPSERPDDTRIDVEGDPLVHSRNGIEAALLHRMAPALFKLPDEAREYRHMNLLDIGEVFLRARGIRLTNLSKMERAGAALGMTHRTGGMHTTTDFALLLADVSGKMLRAAYEAAPQTWLPIAKRISLSDFRASKQLQIGDAPPLLEVLEHGEFTSGTIAEGKEEVQLKTYGRIFAITRQALINDDTKAFSEVPTAFGRAARTLESNLAWAQITSNPTMGDGIALFHASHGNLDASGDIITVAAIGDGRAAMRVQTALDGVTFLNVMSKYLLVPAALETLADQFVSNVGLTPTTPANVNPFAGRLQVIAEPRLDADDINAWYLAADPSSGIPVLYYALLDGETGPVVTQELGFDVDGLRIKCRHDVGFKVADWRGIYKNVGAS